jgi:hypothetical protein
MVGVNVLAAFSLVSGLVALYLGLPPEAALTQASFVSGISFVIVVAVYYVLLSGMVGKSR